MVSSVVNTSRARPLAPRPAGAVPGDDPGRPAGRAGADAVSIGASRSGDRAVAGSGVDPTYSQRRVTQGGQAAEAQSQSEANHEALSLDFAFALQTLPKAPDGAPDPGALLNAGERDALTDAVDRLAREGSGGDAEAALVRAADGLFDEYGRDLGLSDEEVAQARDALVDEVTTFFDRVEAIQGRPILNIERSFPRPLADELDDLRKRLEHRRSDVLEASGDLSRVLAERTVRARDEGTEPALADLGSFVERLGAAADARSARGLRADARNRILQRADAPPPDAGAASLGAAFLQRVQPA